MVFLRIDGREDFYEIFDLEISHREGELALATVVVAENCWHMCQADVVRIMLVSSPSGFEIITLSRLISSAG